MAAADGCHPVTAEFPVTINTAVADTVANAVSDAISDHLPDGHGSFLKWREKIETAVSQWFYRSCKGFKILLRKRAVY